MLVLNLDTGEKVPLNKAEEKIPICINPLSLQIMRRTKEYSRYGCEYCVEVYVWMTLLSYSDSSLHKNTHASDEESEKTEDTKGSSKTLKTIKVVTNKKK